MADHLGNVLSIFGAPTESNCLEAISRALLRVRSESRLTAAQIGELLECDRKTVENATNGKSLLNFNSLARLAYFFPDAFGPVVELWTCQAQPAPTFEDRIKRIEGELSALRREVAA